MKWPLRSLRKYLVGTLGGERADEIFKRIQVLLGPLLGHSVCLSQSVSQIRTDTQIGFWEKLRDNPGYRVCKGFQPNNGKEDVESCCEVLSAL